MSDSVLKQLTTETNRLLDGIIKNLKRIPYDAEIEYLESNGSSNIEGQYIDTGIALNPTTSKFEIKYASPSGGWSGYGTGVFPGNRVLITRYENKNCIMLGTLDTTLGVSNSNGPRIYKLDMVAKTASIDNTVFDVSDRTLTNLGNGQKFYLFATSRGNTSAPNPFDTCLIYYAKFWNGDNLIADFIPVRCGEIGFLYDKISGKLFGNQGTGSFILGPDIVPIEYLESTGTQYIDADVSVALRTTDVSFSAGVLFAENGRMLIGANSSPMVGRSTSGTLDGTSTAISLNTWHDIEVRHNHSDGTYGSRSFYVNGEFVYKQEFTSARTSTPQKFAIFNIFFADNSSIASYWLKGRVSLAKISVDGVLVRDFVPVRVGTTGYLLDRVSHKLYGNDGTGNFVLGPDKA